MSKEARAYYQERAEMVNKPMPRILDGLPFPLVPYNYPDPVLPYFVHRFSQLLLPVQPFLVAGIPEVFAVQDRHLSLAQWRHIQGLPYNPIAHTVKVHAERNVAPRLLEAMSGEAIFTEALTRNEVIETVWNRATKFASNPPKPKDEMASGYFLTRMIDATEQCTAAVFTVAWATYFDGLHMERGAPKKESLTIRYLSASLMAGEIEKVAV